MMLGSRPNNTAPLRMVKPTSCGIIIRLRPWSIFCTACCSNGDSANPPTRKRNLMSVTSGLSNNSAGEHIEKWKQREKEKWDFEKKNHVISLLQNNLTQWNLTKECDAFLRFSSKRWRQKCSLLAACPLLACTFCKNRFRSQLGSTNIRAEGLSSDPVLCVCILGRWLRLLTGPTPALIVSPNGSLVYTALHILLKTRIHIAFSQIFAVCRSWH